MEWLPDPMKPLSEKSAADLADEYWMFHEVTKETSEAEEDIFDWDDFSDEWDDDEEELDLESDPVVVPKPTKKRKIVKAVKAEKKGDETPRKPLQKWPSKQDITDEEIKEYKFHVQEKVKERNKILLIYTAFVILYTAMNCYIYSFEGDIRIFVTTVLLLLAYIAVYVSVSVPKEDIDGDDDVIREKLYQEKKNMWIQTESRKVTPPKDPNQKPRLGLGGVIIILVTVLLFFVSPMLSLGFHWHDLYLEKQKKELLANHMSEVSQTTTVGAVTEDPYAWKDTGTSTTTRTTLFYGYNTTRRVTSRTKEDFYGVDDYVDAADFADEMQDEFDDWEDAYDYYEEYAE